MFESKHFGTAANGRFPFQEWVHRNKGTRGPTRFENDISLISSHEPTMPISQGSREICLSETVEPTCPSKELLPDTAQPALITLK